MMQFRVGDEVEVLYVKKFDYCVHVISGWVPATILEVYGSEFEVETRTQLKINRTKLRVGTSKIRPQPPPEDEYDQILEEGQVIEMRVFNDLWIPGKVWEVYYHGTVGTNNISYSVQAMNITWAGRLTTYPLSRSEVRVRREWVDGEWVPPPHLPPLHLHHHHQQDNPSIRSRDSSARLNGPSSQQWTRPKDRSAALQRLGIGANVEIFLDFMGGWKRATIKGFQEDQIKVHYTAWSWVDNCEYEIDKFYDMSLVRPLPPQIYDVEITFNLHQEIEVYQRNYYHTGNEGWYVGEVLEIYEDTLHIKRYCYSISHPKLGMINMDETCLELRIINVKESGLRVRQEWVDDKWIQSPLVLYIEQPLKRRKMEESQSVGVEVEIYSLYHREWFLGTILKSIENQIEVNIKMRRLPLPGKKEEEVINRFLVDVSRVRPRLTAEKENNLIYKENEAIEVFNDIAYMVGWRKGEIWDVYVTRTNLFYTVKCCDFGVLHVVSKYIVRTHPKWKEGKWSDSSSCVQRSSSASSLELRRETDVLDKRMRSCPELVRGADVTNKRMRSTMTVLKQRKFEYAQFYIGAMVEVFNIYKDGWEYGTVVEIRENQIEVITNWDTRQWFHDVSLIRPKPPLLEEERHQIFQLHDEVEILYNMVWHMGPIFEVLKREDELIYFVYHPTSGYVCIMNNNKIRVHKEWRDGEWIRPLSDSSTDHHQKELQMLKELSVGAEVEVYSFKTRGWCLAIILQLCKNHIEVNASIDGKKWIMHVDVSKIRPPPPREMENDQKFNWGDFIEVRLKESWLKGEIWSIHFEQNNILYTILHSFGDLVTVSKSEIRTRWNWIDGKWILTSLGTSLGTSLQLDKKHTSEIPKGVDSFSQQQSLQACKTLNNVDITNQLTRLGATAIKDEQYNISFPISEVGMSSSIRKKPTRTKRDIGWNHCKFWANPNGKGRILECKYCRKTYAGGGIHRLKEHLAGKERGDARACPSVPVEVRDAIQLSLKKVPQKEKLKQRGYASKDNQQSKRNLHTSTKSHNKTVSVQLASKNEHGTTISRNIEKLAQDDATISCQELMQVPTIQSSSSLHITHEKIITNDGIGEGGKECINSAIKEGKTNDDPTSIDAYSRPVDDRERSVEIVTPLNINCTAIVAGHLNDEFMIDKMEEVIDVNIGRRDSQDKNKIIVDGEEYKCQRDSMGEFIPKCEASEIVIPSTKCSTDYIADHASLFEVEEFIEANQHDDVQGYKIPTNVVAEITQGKQQTINVVEEITQRNQQVDVQVSTNETSTFDLICSRYGDVFRSCIVVGENTRRHWSNEMCEVVQQMQVTTYDNISKDMIDKWYRICLDHKAVKIDNQWLMSRVEEIKKEIDAKMDAELLLSKMKKVDAECEQILSNRSKLDAEYEQLRKKHKAEYEQSGKKLDAEYEQLLSKREKLIEEVAIVNSNRKIEIEKSKVSCPNKLMIDDLL